MIAAFLCLVVAVHDGDTLRCQNGTRVRLAGIDAPEIGACPRYRWCAKGDAQASRRALEGMTLRRSIRCEPVATSYGRTVAWCSIGGVDISCAQYRGGFAIRRWDYDRHLCKKR
jgi:endonuclease YncB( thermonuclease family)